MTAEMKKGRYIYYRCTGFKGACGNTYVREERLADLLGETIAPIQITPEIAAGSPMPCGPVTPRPSNSERTPSASSSSAGATVMSKLDRGYDDFVAGHISEDLWTRKSREWEEDLRAVETELARLEQPRQPILTTAQRILELAQKAEFLYKSQDRTEQRRLLEIVLSNCTFDRGSLSSYLQFAVRPARAREQKRKLAERVGFEPTCPLRDKTLSRRPRYDHFGTSPCGADRRCRILYFTTLDGLPALAIRPIESRDVLKPRRSGPRSRDGGASEAARI